MRINRYEFAAAAAFSLLLGLAAAVFWPALSGPFLFDDVPNLEPLGRNGGIDSFADWLRFVFGGRAGILGRPLSMATFTLNGTDWPTDPSPFKYTNLMLHLLNGVLIFILARQLSRLAGSSEAKGLLLALLGMALWLIHPIHISTMMLVVQRMTELSALFTLAGLTGYLYGRRLSASRPVPGYLVMSTAISLGGILATLSKENGILLPLYALAIEATLMPASGIRHTRKWLAWSALFLVFPLALLGGYFVLNWDGVLNGYVSRPFTIGERLLTEPRILLDYLGLIVLPGVGGAGLFHDDYQWSTSLLSPPITVFALAALIAMGTAGIALRHRLPVLSFGILWFLAGHALESSFIGLELYFEHRNYLPTLGLVFVAAYYALQATGRRRPLLLTGLALFLALQAAISWHSSQLWSDKGLLAIIWSHDNPTSLRAQTMATEYWYERGQLTQAKNILKSTDKLYPDNISVQLQLAYVDCSDGTLDHPQTSELIEDARHSTFENAVFETLDFLRKRRQDCQGMNLTYLSRVQHALLDNPHYAAGPAQRKLHFGLANIHAERGQLDRTITAAQHAYDAAPSTDVALHAAAWLMKAGEYERARAWIRRAREAPGPNMLAELLDLREPEIASLGRRLAVRARH